MMQLLTVTIPLQLKQVFSSLSFDRLIFNLQNNKGRVF